jgi:hypothetical protein
VKKLLVSLVSEERPYEQLTRALFDDAAKRVKGFWPW